MKDKFKLIWAQMRASECGPEPLVIKLHKDEVIIRTATMNETDSSKVIRSWDLEGIFVMGTGKTLDAALDDFSKELDTWLADIEGDE